MYGVEFFRSRKRYRPTLTEVKTFSDTARGVRHHEMGLHQCQVLLLRSAPLVATVSVKSSRSHFSSLMTYRKKKY